MRYVKSPIVLSVLSMLSALSAPARAGNELIEFEFTGVFTRVTNTVHQVGDPFTSTVLFDPDASDTNPSPIFGNYPYIRWTAPSATTTPIVFDAPPATIGSILIFRGTGGGSHTWRVDYEGGSGQFVWQLAIDFPTETFATDALPQTLDLTQATGTRFEAFDGANGVDLRGTITSLTVRVVPEPAVAVWVGALLAIRRRRLRFAVENGS